jgi:hypothetical protein
MSHREWINDIEARAAIAAHEMREPVYGPPEARFPLSGADLTFLRDMDKAFKCPLPYGVLNSGAVN